MSGTNEVEPENPKLTTYLIRNYIPDGEQAAFIDWLNEIRAEAWSEGYEDCFLSLDGSGGRELEDNPYR